MPILVIHGGAGKIRAEYRDDYLAGLRDALDVGYKVLTETTALDAVVSAVRTMEDNPRAFNAGTGGSPNRDGVVECDAAVMDGHDRSAGAVASVTNAKNPILLANRVRRDTPHVLLVGAGANALTGTPIDNKMLLTERMQKALKTWREKNQEPSSSATVGAVALDDHGHLAAATSTGGVLGKWPGRVGDSPLIGSGTYADHDVAISCTGKGEAFIRLVAAKELAWRVKNGESLGAAMQGLLDELPSLGGDGGMISIRANGELCIGFNTPQMAYAWQTPEGSDARVGEEAGVLIRPLPPEHQ